MSGAQWVKITTNIWASDGVKLIRKMPDGDTILTIWFQLITQAGKCNAGGRLELSEFIPLDAEMLGSLFDRPADVVERALDVFKRFGMVDFDDDCPYLPNWYKYQNEDALEKMWTESQRQRDKNKERQQRFRDRRKAETGHNVTFAVTSGVIDNGQKNKNKNKELDLKDLKILPGEEAAPDDIPFAEIVGYLNEKCGTGFKASGDKTKKLIKARWNEGHRVEQFKRVIDTKQAEWGEDPNMVIYLRPETLFGTKFESYLNQRPRGGGPRGGGDGGGKPGYSGSEDYAAFVE
jgi:uncharacterized phage protein (TIGR02220 family)/predicted phage replisome organizer